MNTLKQFLPLMVSRCFASPGSNVSKLMLIAAASLAVLFNSPVGWSQGAETDDSATSATVKRVRLRPILKKKPPVVTLTPILKESGAQKGADKPGRSSEKQPEPDRRMVRKSSKTPTPKVNIPAAAKTDEILTSTRAPTATVESPAPATAPRTTSPAGPPTLRELGLVRDETPTQSAEGKSYFTDDSPSDRGALREASESTEKTEAVQSVGKTEATPPSINLDLLNQSRASLELSGDVPVDLDDVSDDKPQPSTAPERRDLPQGASDRVEGSPIPAERGRTLEQFLDDERAPDERAQAGLAEIEESDPIQPSPGIESQPNPERAKPVPDPDERLKQARYLIERGDIQEGRDVLFLLVRESPKSAQAPQALLLAAGYVQDFDAARRELRAITLNYPDSPETREALARIGEYSLVLGDYAGCIEALNSLIVLETDPDRVRQAEVQLAVATLRAAQYEVARTRFEELQAKYARLRDSPEMMQGEADALLALGETSRADAVLERIETKFPNYGFAAKVLMSRGICAELEGRTDDAGAFYQMIVQGHAKSIEAPLATARLKDLSDPLIPNP